MPRAAAVRPSIFLRRAARPRVLLVVLLLGALFVLGRMVEVDEHLRAIQEWIWGLGPWGPAAYVVLYVAAVLLLVPATPLTILAAFLFGTVGGYLSAMAATTAASVTGFLIARTLGRRAIERRFGGTEAFRKIRSLVEKNQRFAIPFIRLMPGLPFSLNDYALGMTRVSFWAFLFYSEIVFLPMNAVLVLGARAIYLAIIRGEAAWWLIALSAGAALLVLGLGFVVKRTLGAEAAAGGGDPGK